MDILSTLGSCKVAAESVVQLDSKGERRELSWWYESLEEIFLSLICSLFKSASCPQHKRLPLLVFHCCPCLSLPIKFCFSLVCLHISPRLFSLFLLMHFLYVPIFLFPFSCPCGPHLWSRNRVRERETPWKERDANFITTVTECRRGDWEIEKMSLVWGNEMAIALCVCMCLHAFWQKDQGDSLMDISVYFYSTFALFTCK